MANTPASMNRLAQVVLFAKDVDRLRSFYEGVLGLTMIEESPGWCRLDAGGCVLALHALSAAYAGEIADPPHAREDSYLKLCFHTDDVDAARAALVERGVAMRDVHRFGTVAFCDGLDPEGNVFQVTSR